MFNLGQEEILRLLEKKKNPVSCCEIAEELNVNRISVNNTLSKMIEHNEVKFIEISRIEAKEKYGDKAPLRRMRLYFVNS